MNKKLAPFSKPLNELLLKGQRPKFFISLFIGIHAWADGLAHRAEYPTRTITLPPWQDPREYQYPVNDCFVVIAESFAAMAEDEYVRDLAKELYKSKAKCVFFHRNGDIITFKRN